MCIFTCSVGPMQDKLKTKIVTSGEAYTFDGFILVSRHQLRHVRKTAADLCSVVASLLLRLYTGTAILFSTIWIQLSDEAGASE